MLFAVAFTVVAAMMSAVAVAGAIVLRPLWRGHRVLAPAYAVLGLALIAHVVWIAYWASFWLGTSASLAVVLVATAIVARDLSAAAVRRWSPLILLTLIIVTTSVCYTLLYGGVADPLGIAAQRFTLGRPPDNVIPVLFSELLRENLPTAQMMTDWHGSDRPPLQSGLILMAEAVPSVTGGSPSVHTYGIFAAAASLLAQSTWTPAVYSMLRVLKFGRRVAASSCVFVAVTPVIFLNTTYTWPKLLSAALSVVAVALMIHAIRDDAASRFTPLAASGAFVLAFLAHGTAAFFLPVPLALGIVYLVRRRPVRHLSARSQLGVIGGSVGVALVLYLPWQLFGIFADPFTDRLLKWHLAGQIDQTSTGFLPTLRHAYATTPLRELASNRWQNLSEVFGLQLGQRLSTAPGSIARLRATDYSGTVLALGPSVLLVIAVLLLLALRMSRHELTSNDGCILSLVVLSWIAILFWTTIMFLPRGAVVHQGSLGWLLLLLALPYAWVRQRHQVTAAAFLVVSLGYSLVVYTTAPAGLAASLAPVALVLFVSGLLAAPLVIRFFGQPITPPSQSSGSPSGWQAAAAAPAGRHRLTRSHQARTRVLEGRSLG